ncbi:MULTISPECIES: NAD(P)/FAD-dependent oxidoreductase [Novosphingobium]|uniref:FAD-dependent pyridine nucleotide-disulfide oxidoreductase n=1 Tax=Novosphingobium lindaniclasticum LE124 TaxID=1096930 RepID=T0HSH1_9SPHN|nr:MULTISPECIES: FAD-dependent oxidoreductase [Novosphingobium]EQB15078.1 hypothetical protein L284_12495 [Novosphingobium lindaniclasticum LE124]
MTRVLIVGAGHAGGRVAQHLVEGGFAGEIVLVGEEVHIPYERPALSKEFLLGKQDVAEFSLPVCEASEACRFERRVGRVTSVDPVERTVSTADGETIEWDRLVIATGADARRPPIPGNDLSHVHVLRTIDDALRLKSAITAAKNLVIIGAGVIGLEVASSARGHGVAICVIEPAERVMARILSPSASHWLAEQHRAAGTDLRLGRGVSEIHGDAVILDDGSVIAADTVLLATGAAPATAAFASVVAAGADGVPTDAHCRVEGHEHIYAVGDVALSSSPIYGRALRQETWRNAENQAQAVAQILLGGEEPYSELPWMWTDQLGHNIQVVGFCAGDREVVRGDPATGKACLFQLDGDRLVGAVLLGEGKQRKHVERLILDRVPVTDAQLGDPVQALKALA